jgi:hypothetical protein
LNPDITVLRWRKLHMRGPELTCLESTSPPIIDSFSPLRWPLSTLRSEPQPPLDPRRNKPQMIWSRIWTSDQQPIRNFAGKMPRRGPRNPKRPRTRGSRECEQLTMTLVGHFSRNCVTSQLIASLCRTRWTRRGHFQVRLIGRRRSRSRARATWVEWRWISGRLRSICWKHRRWASGAFLHRRFVRQVIHMFGPFFESACRFMRTPHGQPSTTPDPARDGEQVNE